MHVNDPTFILNEPPAWHHVLTRRSTWRPNRWDIIVLHQNFNERLAAHEYLWTHRKHDYVLLQVGTSPDEVLIVDVSTGGEMLLIHDDVLANAIKERMKESQVPVVTEDELKDLLDEKQQRPRRGGV